MNIPETIRAKVGRKLHKLPNHPVEITKRLMLKALPGYEVFEDLDPVVSVKNNFDVLRIPQEHPSRRTSDTYYVNENTVLRTHTSAHQVDLLRQAHEKFLVVGDVYRKDDIDFTHYPVFHQMEGVGLVDEPESGLKVLLFGLN